MSEIKTSHEIGSVISEFDELLNNLSEVLKESRPRTDIRSTKLWKIKKDLSNIENLDLDSMAKVSELASKYNTINNIFTNNVAYNKNDLSKIIEGAQNYTQESNENYNDYFFELSMGVRFLLALKNKGISTTVNLDGVCGIIVNDEIAIECKYIHSQSNMVKNIKEAKKQIEKRIDNNQAKYGLIALDLSHICPREKVNNFANSTLNDFIEMYEMLKSKGYIEGNVLSSILHDRNFYKIISSYILSQVETSFYYELGFSYDLGASTKAIIFQSLNSFAFEHNDILIPLSTRGMTYYLNKELNEESELETIKLIHSLVVGI
ncbi:hypothetical protein HMP0015_2742 [Acinetobacter haemolyticus ATCC 19194]|uniref:Uncharacterized protein n=1 Tax=Acinetobacter haemolyticus ATCC 19194 TaxID=707232 RepID=D4XSQ0_ACIHA|nr:hypothetical protein [Acinetobacter haemolyticus]EFF81790.1 hypothetical protein HMP0015_2742 [Acinetobacter haemolyticus ATCC 19194]